jgi:hypothetical protein
MSTVDSMQGIDWEHISRDDFERLVEALIVRKYQADEDLTAHAVDGRGGDGGVDIDVRRGEDTVHVYQLKHFADGMPSNNRGRRQQVKSSFEEAAKIPTMKEWTLVLPANLTPSERKVVSALRGSRDIRIHVMGRAELDIEFAKYPELLAWATRRPLIEALRDAGHEQAALADPNDLIERVRKLGALSDSVDPDWGTRFSYHGDNIATTEIYAKHANAAKNSPLGLSLVTAFGPDQQGLRQSFERALDYGSLTPVTLPADVVRDLKFTGPNLLPTDLALKELQLVSANSARSIPSEVRIVTESGSVRSSLQGTVTASALGRMGLTFEAKFLDVLTLRFQVPDAEGKRLPGRLDVKVESPGKPASSALKVFRFLDLLVSGESMEIVSGGHTLFRTGKFDPDDDERMTKPGLMQLTEDLAYLEHEFDLTFAMPEELTNRERVYIRMARLLAEGKVVNFYDAATLTGTVTRQSEDPNIDEELRRMVAGPHRLFALLPKFQMEVLGQRFELGTMQVFHPSVEIDDAEEKGRLIFSGEPNVPIESRPVDGSSLMVTIQERGDPNRTWEATPYAIPGFDEADGSVSDS